VVLGDIRSGDILLGSSILVRSSSGISLFKEALAGGIGIVFPGGLILGGRSCIYCRLVLLIMGIGGSVLLQGGINPTLKDGSTLESIINLPV
jgi:hypothetical protein